MLTSDLNLPNGFEFHYSPSPTTQRVHVELATEDGRSAPGAATAFDEAMAWPAFGLAACDRFSPLAGRAVRVSGPTAEQAEAARRATSWVYEVASVAPEFFGWVIYRAKVSTPLGKKSLHRASIRGEALAGEEPIYTEAQMRAWLKTDSCPGPARGVPSFPVTRETLDNGMIVRVQLARDPTPLEVDALQDRVEAVTHFCRFTNYDPKEGVKPFSLELLGKSGAVTAVAEGTREVTLRVDRLQMLVEPVRGVVLNALENYHRTVVPIEHLELSL